ncbi:MAG TPA: hypothetical protein VFN87_22740 [Solirubrobacteraceae bacterium]|nr:hypothetical protein [Solirubrobacteraceae bacterium]
MSDREGVIARIRQVARAATTSGEPAPSGPADTGQERLRALEDRVQHLEALVQGLQDSVHRTSSRHDKQIADLEARIQPGTLGKALSDDARERGL